MTDPIAELLARSLDDRRLSRGERQALAALLAEHPGPIDPAAFRRLALAEARRAAADAVAGPEVAAILDWLDDVLKVADALRPRDDAPTAVAEVHFSPGDACLNRIVALLRSARQALDVCVFTITDDRIADAILDAHRRGVAVRVITDNAKADDLGSDVDMLIDAGIPLRVDRSAYHMHHKFAVCDGRVALSGSYNWTRGAARDNEENIVVTGDPRLVGPFLREFEALWARLA